MDQAITAAEANRQFSRLLGEVREGASYVVTSHGKPVARMVGFQPKDRIESQLLPYLQTEKA